MLDPAAEQCMQPAQPKRHCGDDAPLDLLQIFETKFDSRWTRLNCLDHPWSWASNLKVTKESSNNVPWFNGHQRVPNSWSSWSTCLARSMDFLWTYSTSIDLDRPRSTSIDLVISRSLPDRHTSQLKCCEQILTSTLGVHCSAWVTEACSLADREAWGTTLEISWNQWKLRLSVGHLWCGVKGPGFDTDQAPVWQSALTSWGQSPRMSPASLDLLSLSFTILFHFQYAESPESGRIPCQSETTRYSSGLTPKDLPTLHQLHFTNFVWFSSQPHLTESKILEKLNQHLALTAT